MSLNTTSAVISFYSKQQDQVAGFYEQLANKKQYSSAKDSFLSLAKETHKHKEMVERAYREVITDALEACFAFAMNEGDYVISTDVPKDARYPEVVRKAIELEERQHKFCVDASQKSSCLMSDVTQAFARVAKKKLSHITTLTSLLDHKAVDA